MTRLARRHADEKDAGARAHERPEPAQRSVLEALPAFTGPQTVLRLQSLVGNQRTTELLLSLQASMPERAIQRVKPGEVDEAEFAKRWRSEAALKPSDVSKYTSGKLTPEEMTVFSALHGLLNDGPKVLETLKKLENILEQATAKSIHPSQALHEEMKEKEKGAGFTKPIRLLGNALEPSAFLAIVAAGEAFVDPGAGEEHGGFTHRLQWYILADLVAKDATITSGAPLVRFYELAGKDPVSGGGLWRFLVDKNKTDAVKNATSPEGLMQMLRIGKFTALLQAEASLDSWLQQLKSLPGDPQGWKQALQGVKARVPD